MADHNENLKDTLNEEIEHADQKPAEEHYSCLLYTSPSPRDCS